MTEREDSNMNLGDLHSDLKTMTIIVEMDKVSGGANLQINWILRKSFTCIMLSLRTRRKEIRVANMVFMEKVTKLLLI